MGQFSFLFANKKSKEKIFKKEKNSSQSFKSFKDLFLENH